MDSPKDIAVELTPDRKKVTVKVGGDRMQIDAVQLSQMITMLNACHREIETAPSFEPKRATRQDRLAGLRKGHPEPSMDTFHWPTAAGIFFIRFIDGVWHAQLGDEILGTYSTAQDAVDDLASGRAHQPAGGIKTRALKLPTELLLWEPGDPLNTSRTAGPDIDKG